MIRITGSAKSRLKRINFDQVKKAGLILRLALNNGGQLGLLAGKEQTSDEVYRIGKEKDIVDSRGTGGHFKRLHS